MNKEVKFLAMCIGVLSQYTRSRDYLVNYRAHLLGTFAVLHLRAMANGLNKNELDDIFIEEACCRISDLDAFYKPLDEREDSMFIIYHRLFSCHINAKHIMDLLSKKYTQQEIADSIGISLRTANRWAQGGEAKDIDKVRKLISFYLDSEVEKDETQAG